MRKNIKFYPTSFCMLTLNDISINHLQVGNIGYQYDIFNKPCEDDISLILKVDSSVDTKRI